MKLTRLFLLLFVSLLTLSVSQAKQPHETRASWTDRPEGDSASFAELDQETFQLNVFLLRELYEGRISTDVPAFRNNRVHFHAALEERGLDVKATYGNLAKLKELCWTGFATACTAVSTEHSPELSACEHGGTCEIDPRTLKAWQAERREMSALGCLQGDEFSCQGMIVDTGVPSRSTALAQMEEFCNGGNPSYCKRIAMIGDGYHEEKGISYYEKGCRGGDVSACEDVLESPANPDLKDFARDALRADCDSKDESPIDLWDHQSACSAIMTDASKNGKPEEAYNQARGSCLDGSRYTCLQTAIEMAKNHKKEEVYEMVKEYCRGFAPNQPDHGLTASDCSEVSNSSQASDDIWAIVLKAHASPGPGDNTTFGDYFRAPAGTAPPSKGYELPPLPPLLYK